MKVDITVSAVRIHVTDAEAQRINRGPTPVHGHSQRAQWGENVARAMGFTPQTDPVLAPIVEGNRGVANRGFRVVVFIRSAS